MPQVHFDPQFEVAYRKFIRRNPHKDIQIKKAFKLFSKAPQHPSLNLEKLVSTKIWSIRVNRSDRLFFIWDQTGKIAIFFFIGKHDSYRKF